MQGNLNRIHMFSSRPAHMLTCAALAVAFAAAPALSPAAAFADSSASEARLAASRQQVEQATQTLQEAEDNVADLQALIDQNTADIAEIEAQLPAQRQRAAEAMRAQYKYQKSTNSFLSAVLGITSLDDAISTLAYMDTIEEANTAEIERLNDMEAELQEKKAELTEAKTQADAERQKAADALAEAQRVRSEAQAEAEAAAAAQMAALSGESAAAAGEGADAGNTSNTANQAGQTVQASVAGGAVDWNLSEADFVATWTARIDAYLDGSPLAGYGAVFAQAAWDNGLDPRFSPAIACTESTKGTYCFRDYNAWGWMTSRQFSSWEESISAHVAFLAANYGPTLTPEGAQRYCPPTWQDWYNKVASQMNLI